MLIKGKLIRKIMKGFGIPTATSDATQGRNAGNYMENPQAKNEGRKESENGDTREALQERGDKHTLLIDKVKDLSS